MVAMDKNRWLALEFVIVLAFVLLGYWAMARFAWERLAAWF
jgi:hypothetical protein